MGRRKKKLPILRIEGAAILTFSLASFAQFNLPYWYAIVMIVVPEFFFPDRFRQIRTVEKIYDLLHTYPLPSIAMFLTIVTDFRFEHSTTAFVFLWFAHIGFDRLIGRGAKYDGVFVDRQLALARALLGEPPLDGDEQYVSSEEVRKTPSKWGD